MVINLNLLQDLTWTLSYCILLIDQTVKIFRCHLPDNPPTLSFANKHRIEPYVQEPPEKEQLYRQPKIKRKKKLLLSYLSPRSINSQLDWCLIDQMVLSFQDVAYSSVLLNTAYYVHTFGICCFPVHLLKFKSFNISTQ